MGIEKSFKSLWGEEEEEENNKLDRDLEKLFSDDIVFFKYILITSVDVEVFSQHSSHYWMKTAKASNLKIW